MMVRMELKVGQLLFPLFGVEELTENTNSEEEAAQGKEGPASDEQAVVLAGDWLFGGKKGLGLSGRATKHHRRSI
jgi:hypothetical protein